MSAIGTKRTSLVAPHMSAFGGKADIILGKADINKCPLMTERGQLVLKALFASAPIAEDVVSSQPCSLLNPAPRTCRWPISGVG